MEPITSFVDEEDACVNDIWLAKTTSEQLEYSLMKHYSQKSLQVMCDANEWKRSGSKAVLAKRISQHWIDFRVYSITN
jgi:hypothetical protein